MSNKFDTEIALRTAILGAIVGYLVGDREAFAAGVGAISLVVFDHVAFHVKTYFAKKKGGSK